MKFFAKRYARISLALLAAVLLVAILSSSAAAAGPVYHVVRPGQTLYSIAGYYGVSMWSLACANGLHNPNYIYYGMVLTIPYGWSGGCRPAPQPVYQPQPMPYPQPVAYGCYYRVRWGDSLAGIAWRYGTTFWNLARANKLYNPNYIYAGQILRIPGCN